MIEKLPDGSMLFTRALDDIGKVVILASNISYANARNTLAKIMIGFDSTGSILGEERRVLAWDDMNIVKGEERTRLANRAHAALRQIPRTAYPITELQQDLDDFCRAVDFAKQTLVRGQRQPGARYVTSFWLRPHILTDGAGTIIFARPGAGKSYIGMIMAITIDAGLSALWPETRQARTGWINLERSDQSMQNRLFQINTALGLAAERELYLLTARGKTMTQLTEVIKRAVLDQGIEVLFLDSLSRAGQDLTGNLEMNAIMDIVNSLGISWVMLAHTPRADETHTFGSIMADAAADVMLRLQAQTQENTLGIALIQEKANDLPAGFAELLALDFNQDGLWGVRRAQQDEFPDLVPISATQIRAQARARDRSMVEQMREYLLERPEGEATATEMAEALGFNRQSVTNALRDSGIFQRTRRDVNGAYYGLA